MDETLLTLLQESEDHQNIFDVEEKIGRKCGWQIIAKLKEPYKNEDEYARKFLKMHQEFLSDVYQKNSLEELYQELLYKTLHVIQFANNIKMLESFMILQALFDISTKKQGECLNKCKIVKKSEIRISVEILAVNDLKLKDKNRSDDVFALTYLKSKPESKLKIALQNGSGKDRVYFSSSELTSQNVENLVIEIWEPKKGKLWYGNLIKFSKNSDLIDSLCRMVGSTTLTLKANFPDTLVSKTIFKNPKTCKMGSIDLKVNQQVEKNHEFRIQEHHHLIKLILLRELGIKDRLQSSWYGKFDDAYEKMIINHQNFNFLTKSDVALVRYSVFIKVHEEHRLELNVFQTLLENLLTGGGNLLLEAYEDINKFWDLTSILLLTILEVFVNMKSHMDSLPHAMLTLRLILKCNPPDSFDFITPRKNHYWWIREQTNLNGISGLLYLFKKSVEFGSHNYFESLMKKEKSSRSGDTQILMFTTIVKSLINDMEKMLQIDENANFTRLCLSSIFFKINKINLYALVKSKILKTLTGIKRFNWSPNDDLLFTPNSYDKEETIGLELYQLYLALKQFDSFETEESFEDVSTWFNFEFWLEIIKYNGFMRITKAVLLDNFEPISEYEQITSSAVDTIFVLEDYMKNFNWPEEQKNILFSNIVENICDFCAFYVNRLINHEQCKRNEDILKKYCRTINNLVHIYNNHESYLVGTDAILIENFQRKNKKLIERLLKMVAAKSAEKLFVLFGKKEVTELNKICENIQFTIQNNLDANESSTLLEDLLWFYLSEMIINLVTKSLPTEKPPSFYAKLGDTLHELTIRFLSTEVLERNEKLKEAQTLLKLHGKSDNDLIQQFHKERLKAQQSSEKNFITVNCYFLENKLKIKVLNAKVDTANSLNPYVNIDLLPESIFVDCPEQTTKNLRDPNCLLFDESFEFELTEDQKAHKDAVLMFSFKHKNMLNGDLLGESLLSFNNVPNQLSNKQTRLELQSTNYEVLLQRFKAFNALQYRKKRKVQMFLKKYSKKDRCMEGFLRCFKL